MSFEKFMAEVNATAFFLPERGTSRPKPLKQKRKHWLLKHVDGLTDQQRLLLLGVLQGKLALVQLGKLSYAVRRDGDTYMVVATTADGEPHSVSADLSACTCGDFKFRGHECKHMQALRRIL